MFGKYFAQTFTGSMYGKGPLVFALWSYVIANKDEQGMLELNPNLLSGIIGCGTEEIQEAIDFLASPDPESRSEKEEGRRIAQEGRFMYRVVNHEEYVKITQKEHLRAYNREKKREQRAREKDRKSQGQSRGVKSGQEVSIDFLHEDEDEDVDGRSKMEDVEEDTCPPSGGRFPFDEFWKLYPRKEAKKKAETAWKNLTLAKQQSAMGALPAHIDLWEQEKRGKKLIPLPTTWIHGERWEDEIEGSEPIEDDEWKYEAYRRADMEAHSSDPRWQEYIDWCAEHEPRTAPRFEEWIGG